jgi:hypothetical protein
MPYYQTNTIQRRSYKHCISHASKQILHVDGDFKDVLYIHVPNTSGHFIDSFLSKRYQKVSLFGKVTATMVIQPTPLENITFISRALKINTFRDPRPFPSSLLLDHQRYADLYNYRQALGWSPGPQLKGIVSVRNPYDRVVLAMQDLHGDRGWTTEDLRSFVASDSLTVDQTNICQSEFIKDPFGDRVNWIVPVRTEYMNFDMTQAGFKEFTAPTYKPLFDYRQYLDSEGIDLVRTTYKEDFDWFLYPL